MKQTLYSVYDLKSQIYDRPFMGINDESSKRAFLDASNNPEVPMSKHKEDYNLFAIAEFNDGTGEVTPIHPVRYVAGAIESDLKVETTQITDN